MNILETVNLTKTYTTGNVETHALREVNLQIRKGEFVCIMGPSGCGKSTLLYNLGGLTTPTSGYIKVNQINITQVNDRLRTKIRKTHIGFVFQRFNLLPALSIFKNIAIALHIAKKNKDIYTPEDVLDMVGLKDKKDKKPSQLSAGEQQRVAVARAIATKPSILLADEPTGNLDSENSRQLLDIIHNLNKELKQTIVLITHNPDIANEADRIIQMRDGRIVNS